MNRRAFIVKSCAACLGATAVSGLLSSCASTRYTSGNLGKDGITLSADEFKIRKKGRAEYRPFIIVRNDSLQYPIYVYRFGETEYSAVWMKCSHQGAELQASGDQLQCSAHGSEFNNKGKVTSGPANKDLRSFPVTVVNNNELFIDLREV
jgi:Rieske Fe-S protein